MTNYCHHEACSARQLRASKLLRDELVRYGRECQCTQRLERFRHELHTRLSRVLVYDVRFGWNGVGNSLKRWQALLRLGLAAGRASFLWMMDPQSGPPRFDLGFYFTALGADYRWSAHSQLAVRAAMAARNVTTPTIVQYSCAGRHTWACLRPRLQVVGSSRPQDVVEVTIEMEQAGALLAWLAARPEPWIVLKVKEQTALEQSAPAAAASIAGTYAITGLPSPCAVSGARAAAADRWQRRRTPLVADDRAGEWRPKRPPPEEAALPGLGAWSWDENGVSPRAAAWARPLLERMRAASKDGRVVARVGMHGRCETFAQLRPRPRLVSRLMPYVRSLERLDAFSAVHLRSGYADWQTRSGDGVAAQRAWRAASLAPPMPYAVHWRTFEHALISCDAPAEAPEASGLPPPPCFKWRTGKPPTPSDAKKECVVSDAPPSGWELGAPANGSLASLVTCAGRMADALARRACRERHGRPVPLQSPHAARESCGSWGLLVIGDTPGFVSLVSALPQLRGRVVATSDAGASGHTSFSKTCTPGAAKAAQSSDSHRGACARRTADPGGAWTRSMVDFYLAGLADGFATKLFSAFQVSIGSRSLRISKTHHFGAMYSQQRSHRDRPMLAVPFLRAMMQSEEPGSDDVAAWPRQA